jgi:uncharacterized protein (TIGR02145 family)
MKLADPSVTWDAVKEGRLVSETAAEKLRSTDWNNGTDNYGYAAIATGTRYPAGYFDELSSTSTISSIHWSYETSNASAYWLWIGRSQNKDKVQLFANESTFSAGVRCIKD